MSRAVMQQALTDMKDLEHTISALTGGKLSRLGNAIERLEAALAEPEQIGNARCPRCWEPVTAPTPRKPLTDEKVWNTYKNLWMFHPAEEPRLAGDVLKFARAIERAHGIGGGE